MTKIKNYRGTIYKYRIDSNTGFIDDINGDKFVLDVTDCPNILTHKLINGEWVEDEVKCLECSKETKLNELTSLVTSAISGKFYFTLNGVEYYFKLNVSVDNIASNQALICSAITGNWNTSTPFICWEKDTDKKTSVLFTQAQANILYSKCIKYELSIKPARDAIINSINACECYDDVNNVNLTLPSQEEVIL